MNLYNVYVFIKGFGFDTYTVAANSVKRAKEIAKQRVLEETSMTENDFEVCDTLELDAINMEVFNNEKDFSYDSQN